MEGNSKKAIKKLIQDAIREAEHNRRHKQKFWPFYLKLKAVFVRKPQR